MDTREAGKLGGLIGGKSRSAAKLNAARRNGFKPKAAPTAPRQVPVPVSNTLTIPEPPAWNELDTP
jgi:hypothetical protein